MNAAGEKGQFCDTPKRIARLNNKLCKNNNNKLAATYVGNLKLETPTGHLGSERTFPYVVPPAVSTLAVRVSSRVCHIRTHSPSKLQILWLYRTCFAHPPHAGWGEGTIADWRYLGS